MPSGQRLPQENQNSTESIRQRISRRKAGGILCRASGFFMGSLLYPANSHASTSEILSHKVISKTPDIYCGWPTLTKRRNGQLLLVWSGGREEHVCPFGRVDMMRSDDDGKTWSWPRTLHDSAIDDRDAGILETKQGTLLVTTFSSLAYQGGLDQANQANAKGKPVWDNEKRERWMGAHLRVSNEERKEELGQWMLRSEDGGLSWSKRYRCPVNSPHGPTQLSDGTLLYAGVQLWDDERRVGVCKSTDDGVSWQWLADLPVRDGDQNQEYHELHAVECESGKIICHIRNHNPNASRETLQCESIDGGKTWTEPHPIGVWGLPSFLTRLKSGRIVMSYGYRRKPFGNQARFSDDEGVSWSEPLTISGDGIGSDLGYPSTVELDDGSLLTIWYERMADTPRAVLRQANWRIAD